MRHACPKCGAHVEKSVAVVDTKKAYSWNELEKPLEDAVAEITPILQELKKLVELDTTVRAKAEKAAREIVDKFHVSHSLATHQATRVERLADIIERAWEGK